MRINKYLSSCELGSRRKVEEFVLNKKVKINDIIITDLAYDVKDGDIVKYNGNVVTPQTNKVYIMLNKPRCYITSLKDEKDRNIVTNLLKGVREKVFPVGRLDYNTEGLLILTNDGDFANSIIHPSSEIQKTYEVKTKVLLTNKELSSVRKGMTIDGVKYLPAKIEFMQTDQEYFVYNVTIIEGKNREIRRIFESMKVKSYSLKRLSIGSLKLGNLETGKYKYLHENQIRLVLGR